MLQFSNFMHVLLVFQRHVILVSFPYQNIFWDLKSLHPAMSRRLQFQQKQVKDIFIAFSKMTYYSSMVSEENLFVELKSKIPCELPFLFSHLVVSRWMSIASAVGCIGCSNQSFCVTAFIPKAGGYLCDWFDIFDKQEELLKQETIQTKKKKSPSQSPLRTSKTAPGLSTTFEGIRMMLTVAKLRWRFHHFGGFRIETSMAKHLNLNTMIWWHPLGLHLKSRHRLPHLDQNTPESNQHNLRH